MAPYQLFKLQLVATFGISKDAFHILLGFAVFLIFLLFSKKPISWKLLMPPLVFGIILEILDFRDAINYHLKPNLIDSLEDIIKTTISPALLVLCLYFRRKYFIIKTE